MPPSLSKDPLLASETAGATAFNGVTMVLLRRATRFMKDVARSLIRFSRRVPFSAAMRWGPAASEMKEGLTLLWELRSP